MTTSFPFVLPRPLVADFIAPPLLDASPSLHAPQTNLTIHPPLIAATTTVFAPESHHTLHIPTIASGTVVHQPTVDATYSIVMPTIQLGHSTAYSVGFTGGTNRIDAGDISNMHGDVTIEMWLMPFSLKNRQNPIQKLYWGEWAFTVETNGGISVYQGEGGGTSDWEGWSSSGQLAVGEWTHVVYTRTGQDARFYFDGALDNGPFTWTKVAADTGNVVLIGDGYTDGWTGLIDDVAIYTSALSATQISDHFDAKTEAAYNTEIDSDSPEMWLKLNETSGVTFTDEQSNWDGSLTGSIQYSQTPHTLPELVYEPSVSTTTTVEMDALDASPAIHTLAIIPGSVTVVVPAIASAHTIHDLTVLRGDVEVDPPHLNVPVTLYEPTLTTSVSVQMPLILVGPGPATVDFDNHEILSFDGGAQDFGNGVVSGGGTTLTLTDNAWKKIAISTEVTNSTIIELDFESTTEGEIHGIGFSNTDTIDSSRLFQLHGTQGWGIQTYNDYVSGVTHYTIDVGASTLPKGFYQFLVFAMDDDEVPQDADAIFSNIEIYDGIFEPTIAITVIVPSLDASPTLHEPTLTTTVSVTPPLLGNGPIVHEPTADTAFYVTVPLLSSAVAVAEPTVIPDQSVVVPFVSSGTTVYAPDLDIRIFVPVLDASPTLHSLVVAGFYPITVPTVPSGNAVYEPTLTASADILPDLLDASPTLHEPTALRGTVTITAPLVGSTLSLHEPTLAVGEVTVVIPLIGPDTAISEPVVAASYTVTVPAITATTTLHEPVQIWRTLPVELLDASVAIFEPSTKTAVFAPYLDLNVTPDAPILTTTIDVPIPLLSTPPTLYQPQVNHQILIPSITVGTTVHEPTATKSDYIIVMPLIGSTAVLYDHGLEKTGAISVPLIDASATFYDHTVARGDVTVVAPAIASAYTVHEPIQLYHVLTAPLVASTVTLYQPSLTLVVDVPNIPSTVGVFPPQADITVFIPSLASATAVHEPTLTATVDVLVPSIGSTVTVFAPFTAIYVHPATITGTLVHELVVAATVSVTFPLLTNPTAVHELTVDLPTYPIAVPTIVPGTVLHDFATNQTVHLPLLDAAPTLHEPIRTSTYSVTVPLLDAAPTVPEPTVTGIYEVATYIISAGPITHEPTLNLTLHIPLLGPTSFVFEPRPYNTVAIPTIDNSAVVHEPVPLSVYTLPLSLAVTNLTVYEPNTTNVYTIAPTTIGPDTSLFEPSLTVGSVSIVVPLLNASPTFHEPGIESSGTVGMPLVAAAPTLHEPTLTTEVTVIVPLVSNAPVLHQPQLDLVLLLEHIPSGTTVHQPSSSAFEFIAVPTLDASATLHEPILTTTVSVVVPSVSNPATFFEPLVATSVTVYVPSLSVPTTFHAPGIRSTVAVPLLSTPATLHEFTVRLTVVLPSVASTTTVYAPTFTKEQFVTPGILDAAPTLSEPVVTTEIGVPLPLIGSTVTVYTPTVVAYAHILPETLDASPTLYEPSLFVGVLLRQIPHLPSGTTVHEPRLSGGISIPSIPGGTIIYGPAITLRAPLEIVGFTMGIRQDATMNVGIRADMSQSLLLQNR